MKWVLYFILFISTFPLLSQNSQTIVLNRDFQVKITASGKSRTYKKQMHWITTGFELSSVSIDFFYRQNEKPFFMIKSENISYLEYSAEKKGIRIHYIFGEFMIESVTDLIDLEILLNQYKIICPPSRFKLIAYPFQLFCCRVIENRINILHQSQNYTLVSGESILSLDHNRIVINQEDENLNKNILINLLKSGTAVNSFPKQRYLLLSERFFLVFQGNLSLLENP